MPSDRADNLYLTLPGGHELVERYFTLIGRQDTLDQQKKQAAAMADAVLYAANTTDQLLERWPEVRPFVKFDVPAPTLPDVRREDLNATLKLPVEEVAQ